MSEAYRSYVIRVRRGGDRRLAVRLDVEDLLGGRHAALVGDEAAALDERLRELIRATDSECRAASAETDPRSG